ncbi:MAG: hypothetical protein F4Z31_18995 [Gemmatimonadetes bacterium]|nr:hypothetical protein [Gemmatimonadota bacterium]MYJ11889.1 hypothetical protein [Gemmatimonadota bacterium]
MQAKKWCPFWGFAQRQRFKDALVRAVYDYYGGADVEIDDDNGLAHVEGVATFTLAPAARTCRTLPPDDWFTFLSLGSDILVEAGTDIAVPTDWETARPLLRMKVVTGEWIGSHLADTAVFDELPLGLAAAAVLPGRDSDVIVEYDTLARWGVDEDTAMVTAMENTLGDELTTADDPMFPGQFTVLRGPDSCATGNIYYLERAVGPLGPLGAAVCAPTQDTLLVCPIDADDPKCFDNLAAMMASAHGRFSTAHNPTSPNVLWWRPAGGLEPLARLDKAPVGLVHHPELAEAYRSATQHRQTDGRADRRGADTDISL